MTATQSIRPIRKARRAADSGATGKRRNAAGGRIHNALRVRLGRPTAASSQLDDAPHRQRRLSLHSDSPKPHRGHGESSNEL